MYGELNDRFGLSGQDSLLYLSSGGDFPYFFSAPTHCRHFTTEPLTRVFGKVRSDKLLYSSVHQEALACVNSYDGEYILSDPDWPIQKYDSLAVKIHDEYQEVATFPSTTGNVIYKKR